jgi:hypothetical protein
VDSFEKENIGIQDGQIIESEIDGVILRGRIEVDSDSCFKVVMLEPYPEFSKGLCLRCTGVAASYIEGSYPTQLVYQFLHELYEVGCKVDEQIESVRAKFFEFEKELKEYDNKIDEYIRKRDAEGRPVSDNEVENLILTGGAEESDFDLVFLRMGKCNFQVEFIRNNLDPESYLISPLTILDHVKKRLNERQIA